MSTEMRVLGSGRVMSGPAPTAVGSRLELRLGHACWLSADVLLLTTSGGASRTGQVKAFVRCRGRTVPLVVRAVDYSRPSADTAGSEGMARAVMLRLPPGHTRVDPLDVVLRWSGRSLRLEAAELRAATVSLETLLRQELAALGPAQRADILEFMAGGLGTAATATDAEPRTGAGCYAETTGRRPPSGDLPVSRSLHAAREALRERLPVCVISQHAPQGLNVDAVLAVDDHGFYVQGWIRDAEAVPTRLTAVSPEGSRTELLPRLYRFRRPDVEQFYDDRPDEQSQPEHGWIAYFETSAPSRLTRGWTFEMANAVGAAFEVSAPAATRDIPAVREKILHDLLCERLPADVLRSRHIAPALTRLEERRRSLTRVESVDQHGVPPTDPEVTIAVPLYGRIDFLEHQLAQFVHDPELRRADLVYILDSPELAEPFRVTAAHLAQLYAVPFRAVVLSHNIGFAGVNNVGADLARGRLLLLLNSDVLPREPGWLSAMVRFHDATPGIGALAPKLLYEDDSIQHAGLYFRQLPDTGLWNNEHYFKGLHRSLPAANVPRTVSAVTAACLMVDLALYQEVGGLRGMYVQGDYEDSDLCLRLTEESRDIWYLPSVELYHLEGQSYPSEMRQLTGSYNRWLHTHVWGKRISREMGEVDERSRDDV
jgi:GT2 family glycosyltransferase